MPTVSARKLGLQPKRLARQTIGALGLRSAVMPRVEPLWARYVEFMAPCVFIHIPKTAGTSLTHALGMQGISHSTAERWLVHLGRERFFNRYRFTIVRHPVDRVVSRLLWRFALLKGESTNFGRDYDQAAEIETIDMLVDELNNELRDFLRSEENVAELRMLPRLQVEGDVAVQYIGKFEQLDVALTEVSKHVDIKKPLPKLKSVSSSTKDKMAIDRDVFDLICEKLSEDMEAFEYKPEETQFRVRVEQM